jgi:hypothetical protein
MTEPHNYPGIVLADEDALHVHLTVLSDSTASHANHVPPIAQTANSNSLVGVLLIVLQSVTSMPTVCQVTEAELNVPEEACQVRFRCLMTWYSRECPVSMKTLLFSVFGYQLVCC